MQARSKINVLSWEYVKGALAFPIIVCCCAMSLVSIYASIAIALGLHQRPEIFFPLVVGIAGAVAVPMTIFAFFREHRKYEQGQQLQNIAATDPLTGILNRRAFREAVHTEQLRLERTRLPAALIMFDLDYFKSLNDHHGHAAGDQVLKVIAELAHSELRGPFDRLGRWGGEEFVILLHNVTSDQAAGVAERLRLRIEAQTIEVDDAELCVTASFGISIVRANSSFQQIVSSADEALYEAKARGRNLVVEAALPVLAA